MQYLSPLIIFFMSISIFLPNAHGGGYEPWPGKCTQVFIYRYEGKTMVTTALRTAVTDSVTADANAGTLTKTTRVVPPGTVIYDAAFSLDWFCGTKINPSWCSKGLILRSYVHASALSIPGAVTIYGGLASSLKVSAAPGCPENTNISSELNLGRSNEDQCR